eukprot:2163564-Rhodomonas_salina.4
MMQSSFRSGQGARGQGWEVRPSRWCRGPGGWRPSGGRKGVNVWRRFSDGLTWQRMAVRQSCASTRGTEARAERKGTERRVRCQPWRIGGGSV